MHRRQRRVAYRLMSAKPQRCTLQTKKMSPEDVSFMPAAPANKNTESWPQSGSKTETARRPQKQDRQRILFWEKRGCQNGPKKGTAARSHFCDRSKQNRARQVLAALPVAHPRARMPLAPLTLPALAIPCSWPAICIDLSDTLGKRQIRTRSDPAASTT